MNINHDDIVDRLVMYLTDEGRREPDEALTVLEGSSKNDLFDELVEQGLYPKPEEQSYVDEKWQEVAEDVKVRLKEAGAAERPIPFAIRSLEDLQTFADEVREKSLPIELDLPGRIITLSDESDRTLFLEGVELAVASMHLNGV